MPPGCSLCFAARARAGVRRIGHHNVQIVVAFAQVFGDVEEEWQVAAPVLAHHVTVHAHAAPLVDGTEMQDDPFPEPTAGLGKLRR